tara:strand:- start:251 stop:799 length:549 start_codon:yes stop_codon:yes gene_type:complete
MAIAINGSTNVITGVAVGGLPDGIVDRDTLATLAKGSVLQVVQNQYSTQTSINSTSYVDTGLTATITPSSSSSKVLVMAWLYVTSSHFSSPYNVYGFGFNLVRGTTEIKTATTSMYYQAIADNDISYTVFNQPHIAIYLDSPNTTSATTYKIQGKESDVNANCTVNSGSQKSEMILIEVVPS